MCIARSRAPSEGSSPRYSRRSFDFDKWEILGDSTLYSTIEGTQQFYDLEAATSLALYARFNIRTRKCIGLTYQVVKQTVNQLSGIELNRANNSCCRAVVYCEQLSIPDASSLFQSEYVVPLFLSLPPFSFLFPPFVPFSPVLLDKISRTFAHS